MLPDASRGAIPSSSSTAAPPRKRMRVDSSYTRQRAITACNVCRARKTKCDNKRPSCGFCQGSGVVCVYEDARSDFSNYDAASLCIIDRLDRIGSQLNERLDALSHLGKPTPSGSGSASQKAVTAPLSFPTLETVLLWPIFEDCNLGLHSHQSLALRHIDEARQHDLYTEVARVGPEMIEPSQDRILILTAIESFLDNVHAKNPILDVQSFRSSIDTCLSLDTRYSEQWALLYVSSALGMIAKPFVAEHEHLWEQSRSTVDGSSGKLAESYFTRARMIMSVSTPSLTVVQCLFFCGVYEMFLVRPVDAYLHFNRASTQLKFHLLGKRPFDVHGSESTEGRLLRRLYWSCMQSECELAAELLIPSCGLEDLDFPHSFPSPPSDISHMDETGSRVQSWMYYSAETSLRRISQEIVSTLHCPSARACTQDVEIACLRAKRLTDTVEAWMAHLPRTLLIETPLSQTTNELSLHVRSRYLMCRAWIHQPFLYFLIHATPQQLDEDGVKVEALALEGIHCAIQITNDVTLHHRHHGTWFVLRIVAQNALVLLAAAKSQAITLPDGWELAVQRAIGYIEFWAGDSGDLPAIRSLLEAVSSTVVQTWAPR